MRSLLVAPLSDENGVRGAVLLGRGRAASVPFARAELQLFETFSNHLGTTLEKARLNTSLAQLQEAKQLLAFQAYHDSLTGLGNRVLFGEKVGEAIDRARRGGGRVGVLFIDLDDFKTVNDTMGHAAGDELLVGVAQRISGCLGERRHRGPARRRRVRGALERRCERPPRPDGRASASSTR